MQRKQGWDTYTGATDAPRCTKVHQSLVCSQDMRIIFKYSYLVTVAHSKKWQYLKAAGRQRTRMVS